MDRYGALLRDNSNGICLSIDEICPPLQHGAPMFEVKGGIVGATDLILINVSELGLDPVRFEMAGLI